MKRYISAILIPCFLLQLLSGCYSYQEITLDELKNYKERKNVIINRDTNEIMLKGEYRDKSGIDWETNDSSIIINSPKLIYQNGSYELENMKYDIKYNNIKTIEIEEFDFLKTVGLVGIIGLCVGIIAGITIFVAKIIKANTWEFPSKLY